MPFLFLPCKSEEVPKHILTYVMHRLCTTAAGRMLLMQTKKNLKLATTASTTAHETGPCQELACCSSPHSCKTIIMAMGS